MKGSCSDVTSYSGLKLSTNFQSLPRETGKGRALEIDPSALEISDTPLIDHLVMREFVSGPPSYRFIYERVRDRKPSLRKGS